MTRIGNLAIGLTIYRNKPIKEELTNEEEFKQIMDMVGYRSTCTNNCRLFFIYRSGGRARGGEISWQGLYAGVHFGYGLGNGDTTINPLPTAAIFINLAPQNQNPNPQGILGGVQVGYNYQMGKFVIGAETTFSLTDMRGTKTVSPITQNNGTPFPGAGNNISTHESTDYFGTVRLRAGAAPVPKLLLYATGGLAYGQVQYEANTDFRPVGTEQYPASFSKFKVGWTAGAGVEYALIRNMSIKAEYLYYNLGDESVTANPVPPLPPFGIEYTWKTQAHIFNIGLSYKF